MAKSDLENVVFWWVVFRNSPGVGVGHLERSWCVFLPFWAKCPKNTKKWPKSVGAWINFALGSPKVTQNGVIFCLTFGGFECLQKCPFTIWYADAVEAANAKTRAALFGPKSVPKSDPKGVTFCLTFGPLECGTDWNTKIGRASKNLRHFLTKSDPKSDKTWSDFWIRFCLTFGPLECGIDWKLWAKRSVIGFSCLIEGYMGYQNLSKRSGDRFWEIQKTPSTRSGGGVFWTQNPLDTKWRVGFVQFESWWKWMNRMNKCVQRD